MNLAAEQASCLFVRTGWKHFAATPHRIGKLKLELQLPTATVFA
jgi:hypothetical protein